MGKTRRARSRLICTYFDFCVVMYFWGCWHFLHLVHCWAVLNLFDFCCLFWICISLSHMQCVHMMLPSLYVLLMFCCVEFFQWRPIQGSLSEGQGADRDQRTYVGQRWLIFHHSRHEITTRGIGYRRWITFMDVIMSWWHEELLKMPRAGISKGLETTELVTCK